MRLVPSLKDSGFLRRYPRHLRNLALHSTPRRLANMALTEAEYRLGRTTTRGKPYIVFLDPVNVCNLRCPLCPTGTGDLERSRGTMTMEECRSTIDEVAPWAFEIVFYNWGEPLLNPHIFEMVRYARSKNIGTSMSSNLTVLPRNSLEDLVTSGLENFSVSIDGACQETYSQYRVGGNFDTVIDNLKALLAKRRELNSSTPVIEWQFIVMKHNEHEIERARALAEEIGVDLISFIPVALSYNSRNNAQLAEQWFSTLPEYRFSETSTGWTVTKGPWRRWFSWVPRYRHLTDNMHEKGQLQTKKASRCFYLYRALTVNPGGGVAPCCVIYDESQDTGNIREGLGPIWNNELYQSMRAEFHPVEQPKFSTICSTCHIFEKPANKPRRMRSRRNREDMPPEHMLRQPIDVADIVFFGEEQPVLATGDVALNGDDQTSREERLTRR